MNRFLPKFLACFIVFFASLAYYRFGVLPSLSGEFGVLGQIPFGKEYEGLSIDYYDREPLEFANVANISSRDSVGYYRILTIGDSFSQYGPEGYQWRLSHLAKTTVGNIKDVSISNPIQAFVSYANSGLFSDRQTIIVECVERHLIERLSSLDFSQVVDNHAQADNHENDSDFSLLNMFFSWIRLSIGFDSPVRSFDLKEELFTHPKYSSTLFVYNSKKTDNGDLLWENRMKDFDAASLNLIRLDEFAKEKGLELVFLIATDKYDAYEPWIAGVDHQRNPTLSVLPNDPFIINTKPFLQEAISRGEKDIYKVNNTHWSVIGADLMADLIFTEISANSL